MAIDDNTLYGLTGAQVKELPGKIEAVKGLVKELTTDDYNWPTNNPDGVAMWLLPEGVYSCDTTTGVYADNGASAINRSLFFKFNSGVYSFMAYYAESDNSWRYWRTVTNTGVRNSYGRITPEVTNSLTSTSTDAALSAAQGKALKDLVDSLAIRGAGAPTTSTVGQVGTLYEDTTNGDLYICTDATNPYIWEEIGAGGGGPTVVQTAGASTTDVMSQNAVTGMIFADPATRYNVNIGGSYAGYNGVTIGFHANGYGSQGGIAIGENAYVASKHHAVAIGDYSTASARGEFSIGNPTSTNLYNGTGYRLLTNVYDPQSAHDAATKGYVDGNIPSTFTTNEWNALWA